MTSSYVNLNFQQLFTLIYHFLIKYMLLNTLFILLSLFYFLHFAPLTISASINPTWIPNTYIETQPITIKSDISTSFNQTNPQTRPFTFTKAYTTSPQFAFGIKNYRPSDKMGVEDFRFTISSPVTTTGFSIKATPHNHTNLRILNLQYIAIDRSFPYHINTFNDIPANFSTGSLSNIKSMSSSVRSYINTINYTTLASTITTNFKYFGPNLNRNIIAMYLTAMWSAHDGYSYPSLKMINEAKGITNDKFTMNVTVSSNWTLNLMRYSLVVFDLDSIDSSGKFTGFYLAQEFTIDSSNQFYSLPQEFFTSSFIGLLDFTISNVTCSLEFNWEFDSLNNRTVFNKSVVYPYANAICGTRAVRVNIFYLKTWTCPALFPYYNIATFKCDDFCPSYKYPNSTAKECQNCAFACFLCASGPLFGCTDCNAADFRELVGNQCVCKSGYFTNPIGTTVCKTCSSQLANCATCQNTTGTFQCLTCATNYLWTGSSCLYCLVSNCLANVYTGTCTCSSCAAGYVSTGPTCLLCSKSNCLTTVYVSGACACSQCAVGYIIDGLGGCKLCEFYMPGCIECTSQTICTKCNQINQFYLNNSKCQTCNILGCATCKTLTTCLTCNNAINYFITPTQQCTQCLLNQCTTCTSLTQCGVCNAVNGYFVNTSNKVCQLCALSNCLGCASLTTCSVCNPPYFLNGTSLLCEHCSLPGCNNCVTFDTCINCDNSLNFFLNATLQCQKCPIPGCLDCDTISTCLTCDLTNDYFTDGTSCLKCPLVGCGDCQSPTVCNSCDQTANYFNVSNVCTICTLTGCKNCLTLTQCLICDETINYFLIPGNTCSQCILPHCMTCLNLHACQTCDEVNKYFEKSGQCQLCTTSHCIICLSLTECEICDQANDYFPDANKQCVKCTIPSCVTCLSLSECQICDEVNDYFLTSGRLCQKCTLPNCDDCSSLTTCALCDEAGDYFMNASFQCQKCALVGCFDCTSATQCHTCDQNNDYFITASKTCSKCSLNECTDCLSLSTCSVCNDDNNFFVNQTTYQCQTCQLTECLTCFSLEQCQICSEINNFFLNPLSKVCEQCLLEECLECSSLAECIQCNEINHFFLNLSTKVCEQCTLNGCLQCSSLTTCSKCDNNMDLFLNYTSLKCQPCSLQYCLACDTLYTCSVCNTANFFFLSQQTYQCYFCNNSLNLFVNELIPECELCALHQCLTCQSLTYCSHCNQESGYFLNPLNKKCETCPVQHCVLCASLTLCKVCDSTMNFSLAQDNTCNQCPFTCECDGYLMPQYHNQADGLTNCQTLCGDGMKRNFQQCDDGNLVDGDGCSSKCEVESFWVCDHKCCTLSISGIALSVNKISKIPKRNAITLQIQINPKLPVFSQDNLHKFVILTVTAISLFNESRIVLDNQIIEVTYNYNQSIHGKQCNILFEINLPQTSVPSCYMRAEKKLSILTQASNNLPFIFYTQEQLQRQEETSQSIMGLEIATYVIFFVSLIPAKINGLELIGVLQLAFFSLSQQQNVNALLQPIMSIKEVNGFNANIFAEDEKILPDKVSSLGIKSLFLNNCNVMLGLITIELIAAGVLFAVAHFIKSVSKKVSTAAKYLIKEGFMTLMMFNAFNIAFGVGIHFHYADSSNDSYALSSFAAVVSVILLLIPCVLLIVSESKEFGQFKNKLKRDFASQLYFVLALVYRFVLGFYIGVKNEYSMSSLVVVGLSMLWISYNFVNLPFKQAYQNYRANCCHIAQLIILMVTNYYESMLENEQLQKKAYIFRAAEIQIGSIYICVILSAICLAYDIRMFIKKKIRVRWSNKVKHMGNDSMPDISKLRIETQGEINNSMNIKQNSMHQYIEE